MTLRCGVHLLTSLHLPLVLAQLDAEAEQPVRNRVFASILPLPAGFSLLRPWTLYFEMPENLQPPWSWSSVGGAKKNAVSFRPFGIPICSR